MSARTSPYFIAFSSSGREELFLKFATRIGYLIISINFVVGSLRANLDLVAGRYELFMDERLIFDGVHSILHPSSFGNFLQVLFDGGDQRYGRILWNLSAFFSVIPERMFGETGQIAATRFLMSGLILTSGILLTKACSANRFEKLVIFSVLLNFPFAAYYSTMPKPEPLLIFMISLLIFVNSRYPESLSPKLEFFLLGLIFGTKISMLFFVFVYIYFYTSRAVQRNPCLVSGFFLMGLSFAVPILILPSAIVSAGLVIFRRLESKVSVSMKFLLGIVLLAICGSTYRFFTHIFNQDFIRTWINWTFLNTQHGSDSNDVNFFTWVNYFYNTWAGSKLAAFGFIICASIFLIQYLITYKVDTSNRGNTMLFTSGAASVLAIMVFTHRLWGMYLYIGAVLLFLGTFQRSKNLEIAKKISWKSLQWIKVVAVLSLLLPTLFINSQNTYANLASRTNSKDYFVLQNDYQNILDYFLEQNPRYTGTVQIDPNLFEPNSLQSVKFEPFWGSFSDWGRGDFILLGLSHLPKYSRDAFEISEYVKHVQDDSKTCSQSPCYTKELVLPSGGVLLRKVN